MAKPSILVRLQDWFAGRDGGFRYPKQEYLPKRTVAAKPFFKYQMPLLERFALFNVGLLVSLVSVVLLGIGLCAAWGFIQYLIS